MSFAQTFMYFASPALCGIKPANLFSLNKEVLTQSKVQFETWAKEFETEGRNVLLIERGSVMLVFVYDTKLLEEALFLPFGVRQFLEKKGYPNSTDIGAFLKVLLFRLSVEDSFPNEVGLFLGYPLEDVIAFEKYAGRGSKYTGIWQVYGNVEEACKKMQLYKNCSKMCCKMLGRGENVTLVCKLYREKQARLQRNREKLAS